MPKFIRKFTVIHRESHRDRANERESHRDSENVRESA
jgi:hypothetical protein